MTGQKVSVYLSGEVLEQLEAIGKVFKWSRSQCLSEVVAFYGRLMEVMGTFQVVVDNHGEESVMMKVFDEGGPEVMEMGEAALAELVKELKKGVVAEFGDYEAAREKVRGMMATGALKWVEDEK